jgi:hypothetical protein
MWFVILSVSAVIVSLGTEAALAVVCVVIGTD